MPTFTRLSIFFVAVSLLAVTAAARAADLDALSRAAAAGDATAALALGTAYDTGDGVPVDPQTALHWYEVAARGGNAAAMFDVGAMYDSGIGTARDRAAAARWYLQAAQHGHPRAAYDLGLLYETGEGVHRNLATAARWFHAAATGGLTAAQAKLTALAPLLRPDTGDADYTRAQALIEAHGLRAAGPEVLTLLRRAAERGFKVAQYDLGYLYENGLGVPTDRLQAYVWYRRAAQPGVGTEATILRAASAGATRLAARLDPSEKAAAMEALRTASR